MYQIEEIKNKIICGDTLTELKKIPSESIDLIITSPPYYGLRNYQVEGQVGLEKTFDEYLEKILKITAELKRVLKKTGQMWWNMGDCYGMAKSYSKEKWAKVQNKFPKMSGNKCLLMQPERLAIKMIDEQNWILRNKIKWAKQILIKKENKTIGSVMPTSVKDRFNESGEELYFFVKNKKYWCDLDAVRLPNQYQGIFDFRPISLKIGATRGMGEGYPESKYNKFNYRVRDAERKVGQPQFRASEEEIKKYRVKTIIDPNIKGLRQAPEPGESNAFNIMGKNIPTIWQINPEPHNFQKELDVDIDHFAVFPEALCEIPIKFGCPKLVCKKCGRAREKIFNDIDKRHWTERQRKTKKGMELNRTGQRNDLGGSFKTKQREFSGLSNCGCNAGFEPGIVLDPFCGSGTALVVAKKLSRNYVGIELNKNYCEIAQKRLNQIPKPLF